jgi:pyruvate/2-oxoglutarate dehydrogenase complex dihydrolipoamide dehydrogenase (E3) component
LVAGARQNYASRLAQGGLDLIEGEAHFSEVTIVQTAARLMMIEDEDVSDEVAAILRDDGITILTSATPVRVERADGDRADGDRLRLAVDTGDGERQLEGSHLLSAIGRIPNTEALTPEAAGIRLDDHGFIEIDEYLETSVPGVYAMGTSRAARASRIFPTTITASCTPT